MDDAVKDMYGGLNKKLHEIKSQDLPLIQTAKKSVRAISEVMPALKSYIVEHPFATDAEEIIFFKETKPAFHSLLVCWIDIYEMELNKPVGGPELFEAYNKAQLQKLQYRFSDHSAFYNYYRSGETFLDEQYFLCRNRSWYLLSHHVADSAPDFSTSHDFLVTRYLADEMFLDYINHSHLHTASKTALPKTDIVWTASKAGLVEILYAFQSGGVFNNGQASIRDIAMLLEKCFGIELGNYYQVFNEIRLRKKGRAQLLDQLKKGLEGKMDQLDER